jgi:ribonuclease-3
VLKDKIGYTFQNDTLFQTAMTHSSYANEQRARHLHNNERLEFLGDSVLGFVTADYLFNHYRELPEGELTKLRAAVVCEQALYEIAKELGIDREIKLGHGEETGGGRRRPSILADAVEALLGAIYLDGGIEPARAFVLSFIPRKADEARRGGMFKDYKTMLQEIVQKNREETLQYRLAGSSGPDHNKSFTMELLLNSNVFAKGTGKSKKEAEQMAARQALELMGVLK